MKVQLSCLKFCAIILVAGILLLAGSPYVGRAASGDEDATQESSISTETSWVDLSLTKEMSLPRPREGETVTFTLTITNAGPGDATGIVITDTLPSGFSYLSADGGGVYTAENATATWRIPLLRANESLSFHLVARTEGGFNHTNWAEIIAVDQPDVDSTPGNHNPYEDDQDYSAPQVVIYPNSYVGDRVWWDVDGNGLQDPGEPGIPNVLLTLTDTQGLTQTTITDEQGLYHFEHLFPGVYTVTVDARNFQPGGSLLHWRPSPANQGDDDTQDSDGDPRTYSASLNLGDNETNTSLDFGFELGVSYLLSQQRHVSDPIRPGQSMSFTVIITNTSHAWLTAMSLQDVYDPEYLEYGNGTDFAVPDSVNHIDDGILDWPNVLGSSPLAPGEAVTVTLYFTARNDTYPLPNQATLNTIMTRQVQVDPDGPTGALAPQALSLPQSSSGPVRILAPTGVIISGFYIQPTGDHVQLSWDTASELNLLGFSLLRLDASGQEQIITPQLILAQRPGLPQGSHYTFLDTPRPGNTYYYILRIHTLDGRQHTLSSKAVALVEPHPLSSLSPQKSLSPHPSLP